MLLKRVRTFVFWCHLVTGACIGLVVLLMSATGVLLTYQRQLTAWADVRGIDAAAPAAPATRLPVDSLVARARVAAAAAPTALAWRASTPRLVQVAIGRERVLYLDAFTGEVVGRGSPRARAFFAWITDWHRWLGAAASDTAARARGKSITGAANLAFLFLVLSGFWLWWPRNWNPAALRGVTLFRRGLRGKARDFNWHNVVGVWSVLPLFLVVLSGVVISYPWASALVYRAVGEQPPAPAAPPRAAGERTDGASAAALPPGIDAMLAHAEGKLPGWRSIAFTIPRTPDAPVSFTIDRGTGGEPQKRATLTLDPATGAERKWETFDSLTAGRRARSVLRFAHTGEVLGLAGQTIAGLVSLGATLLVWTGISLSLRRLGAWRRRRVQPRATPA